MPSGNMACVFVGLNPVADLCTSSKLLFTMLTNTLYFNITTHFVPVYALLCHVVPMCATNNLKKRFEVQISPTKCYKVQLRYKFVTNKPIALQSN